MLSLSYFPLKQSKNAMKLVLIALIAIFNQEVSYGQFFGPSKFSSKACQVYICGIKCLRVVFAKNIKNLRSKRSFFYKVCDWKSGFFFLIFPSNIWPQLWKYYSLQFVYQLHMNQSKKVLEYCQSVQTCDKQRDKSFRIKSLRKNTLKGGLLKFFGPIWRF